MWPLRYGLAQAQNAAKAGELFDGGMKRKVRYRQPGFTLPPLGQSQPGLTVG